MKKLLKPNKRMYEYWLDESETGEIIPIKMPFKYVVESFCDMLGASKAYNKEKWEPEMLWNYWKTKCEGKRIMHRESTYLTKKLIWNLRELGEKEFFNWYKTSKDYLKEAYENGTLSSERASFETGR